MPALTVAFGTILTCALVPQAFAAAQAVARLTAVRESGVGDVVAPAGTLAFSAGLLALFLSQGFVVWFRWVRPSARFDGFGLLRLAQRKVDGHEPYWPEDVPELRSLAEDRIARSRRVSWAERIGAAAVVVTFLGMAMAPPVFGDGVVAEAATQVLRYLCVVLALVGLAGVVTRRRTPADVRAEAFLERAASVPDGGATLGRTENAS